MTYSQNSTPAFNTNKNSNDNGELRLQLMLNSALSLCTERTQRLENTVSYHIDLLRTSLTRIEWFNSHSAVARNGRSPRGLAMLLSDPFVIFYSLYHKPSTNTVYRLYPRLKSIWVMSRATWFQRWKLKIETIIAPITSKSCFGRASRGPFSSALQLQISR